MHKPDLWRASPASRIKIFGVPDRAGGRGDHDRAARASTCTSGSARTSTTLNNHDSLLYMAAMYVLAIVIFVVARIVRTQAGDRPRPDQQGDPGRIDPTASTHRAQPAPPPGANRAAGLARSDPPDERRAMNRAHERHTHPGQRGHHRGRHRRQQPGVPPGPARLARAGAGRQGPDAEPRRLDRPRVELHLPDRVLEDDDGAHRRQHRAVPGTRRAHPERRDRGGQDRGAHAGAAPALHGRPRPGRYRPS